MELEKVTWDNFWNKTILRFNLGELTYTDLKNKKDIDFHLYCSDTAKSNLKENLIFILDNLL